LSGNHGDISRVTDLLGEVRPDLPVRIANLVLYRIGFVLLMTSGA
jgi:hypothetical protein